MDAGAARIAIGFVDDESPFSIGTQYTYGAGYGDQSALDGYQEGTQSSWDLWGMSSQAAMAGDSYGASLLEGESVQAQSDANDSYHQYYGTGAYAPAEGYSEAGAYSGYDTGADSGYVSTATSGYSSYDSSSSADAFDDYIRS